MEHESVSIATLSVMIATTLVSLLGFRNKAFLDRLLFSPERILVHKEHYRLITSGFLHADWWHLLFNMYSFYCFGTPMEQVYGAGQTLLIYSAAIVGGNLLSLYLHRNHIYTALGASGGVCGIIFAFIFLFPGSRISMIFVPLGIPAWLYAVLFMAGSYYALRAGRDNIGHDAHLGGAVIGLLVTTALHPEIVKASLWLYVTVMALSVGMLVFLVVHPLYLPWREFEVPPMRMPKRAKPSPAREPAPEEVNRILDKISKSGIQSLSKEEHDTLLRASKDSSRK
jgi:membrane associated rhomboid family serine protease